MFLELFFTPINTKVKNSKLDKSPFFWGHPVAMYLKRKRMEK